MDTISSAEFRRTYQRLTKPMVVTANGHMIGIWSPTNAAQPPSGDYIPPSSPEKMAQEARDAILRRVQKGGTGR